ncbi:hypothetical protein PR202_gb14289 [Eleusine coracana subsp. coracana]|uniref:Phytocyanin domain-containing protein n=1 Tax=Eleusine coracana subsp. coracana TaxID=191504 RepID=A0AAV5EV89_ELECO|nr:hypothetical protein QOZ80_4BG0333890 [Eleusine coracana subsp. coracana]GJN26363.1 hypothetical protein PR202_gb14289 [Eleusine coracana subsp. coracana]
MSPLAKALVALVALASVAELAAAKNYTIQWTLKSYGDWSAANILRVGDVVEFSYGRPHTVDELSKADYEACSFANPISTDNSGPTAFTFDKAGTRYFACAAGTHCSQGQKVAITVGDGTTGGGAQSPAPPAAPKGNAAAPMGGAAEFAVKLVLGLGVGGVVLAAF